MLGLLLLVIAFLIAIVLLPIGLVIGVICQFGRLNDYLFSIAQSIDQLGNVVCADMFNATLIKKNLPHPFGNIDETISSVLGKNARIKNLTWLGKGLAWFLDKVDKGHLENSIGS